MLDQLRGHGGHGGALRPHLLCHLAPLPASTPRNAFGRRDLCCCRCPFWAMAAYLVRVQQKGAAEVVQTAVFRWEVHHSVLQQVRSEVTWHLRAETAW